jgi:DNA-binding protein H-NS
MPLANLPVDELLQLRAEADRILAEKLASERKSLTDRLRALDEYEATARLRGAANLLHALDEELSGAGQARTRARAAAKYRDPATGATWAGRGQQPRWMRRAIEAGAHQEDFRIRSKA